MENLEYNQLELNYLKLFDKLPPYYVGINKNHPIYLKLLKESIENKKELDLNVFEKEVKRAEFLFNI